MACGACEKQRQKVMQSIKAGNVRGAVKAVSLGARMMAEKAMGVDIEAKYGREVDRKK